MSIDLKDAELRAIEKYEQSIARQRAEAWDAAVEMFDKSREKSTTLSKSIAKGEINNLMIARPSMPKRPKFETQNDIDRYINKLREAAEYGKEKSENTLIHRYIGSARKAWGDDVAQELLNLANSNPAKFIQAVNSGVLPPPKFLYQVKDTKEVDNFIDDIYEYMSEYDYDL